MNQIKIISDIRIIVAGIAGADADAVVVCFILRQSKHDLCAQGIPYSYCFNHSLDPPRPGFTTSRIAFHVLDRINTQCTHGAHITVTIVNWLLIKPYIRCGGRVVAQLAHEILKYCVCSAIALSCRRNIAGATNDCTTINDTLNTKWRITCVKSGML